MGMRRRLALLSASVALAALLVAGGAAWAATLSFAPAKGYPAGNAPNGVAAGDLDGDGDQDLMSANSGGGFTDGRPDYSILGTVSVFKNRGDGTFAAARNFTAGGAFEPSRLDRSDFDGDGDLDLVVSLQFTRAGDGGLAVMFNAGDGSFGLPQRYEIWSPESVIANDLDGDGDQDLATTGTDSYTIEVYKNRGDGTFEYSGSYYLNTEEDGAYGGQYSPGSLTEADFDRDGDVDLATSHPPFDKISVLLNSGDGTFGSYETVSPTFAAGDHPHEITRARMNADSRPDLVVANGPTDKVSVLLNTTQ